MLDLRRRAGRPLVIGHRGAPAVAPENTLASFRAAVSCGADLVELDVLDLDDGTLVVAHSDDLWEVSHGAGAGRVRGHTLDELRAVAPDLPTLDDALDWFAAEAPSVGVHLDLKLRSHHERVPGALRRHGLAARSVVSSDERRALRAVAACATGLATGLTYPQDRHGLSRRRGAGPLVAAGLMALRATSGPRLPGLVGRAGADALMLHHALATASAVARLHALGVPVLAWTVDDPDGVRRVAEAGVDGVISNDPATALATLEV